MVIFPNCKINLGLLVLARRPDGFHNIETCFLPIPYFDVLEFIEHPQKDFIQVTGFEAGKMQDNICLKALKILRSDFPELPFVKIHLHKNIPVGAGLGGGSANGAFFLQILNQRFNLGLDIAQLKKYALDLGSDCPFFIVNSPCIASGRGEVLKKVDVNLEGYKLVLITPDIRVSTAEAFKLISPKLVEESVAEVVQTPVTTWRGTLINDFEKPIFKKYPPLAQIRDNLYKLGSEYAAMSGSGSTIYGLFKNWTPFTENIFSNYRCKVVNL